MSSKRQRRKVKQRRKLLRESAATAVKLSETGSVATSGGSCREVTIIEAGWGSSGYYSAEMLGRDGPGAWPAGTHMYMNHPSMSEEIDRPERDARDLVGVLETTPVMQGKALVAEAKIFEHWQPVINEIGPHIGLSIRAAGEIDEGEAEGRKGTIIEKITEGISVDFVTMPGAGGKVGPLIESARLKTSVEETTDQPDEGEGPVILQEIYKMLGVDQTLGESRASGRKDGDLVEISDKELSELKETVRQTSEKVTNLEESVTKEKERANRAEDALVQERAARIVNEALTEEGEGDDALPKLPERAVSRVKEAALRGDVPLDEDGKIDKDKLIERVRKAAKEEDEYLRGSVGNGVTGMGESVEESGNGSSDEPTEEDLKALEESFKRSGMSEEAAKLAARGR